MKKLIIICMLASICTINNAGNCEEILQTTENRPVQEEVVQNDTNNIQKTEEISKPVKVLKAQDKVKYDNLCEKANTLIDQGKYEQAEANIKKALAISTDLDMAYALQSRISCKKNINKQETINLAKKALDINPNNYVALNVMGVESEDSAIAIEYYEKSHLQNKNFLPPIINLANSYSNEQEYDKAIMYLTKYINLVQKDELKKKDNNEYVHRAVLYRITEKYDLALKDTNSALLLNKNNPYALAEQGYNYALKGNFKEGIKSVNKAVQLGENLKDPIFYSKRIAIYKLMNTDYSMVQKDIKTVESLAGKNVSDLYDLVRIYMSYSKIEEANRVCEKILAKYPDDQKVLLTYGSNLAKLGKPDEALEAYKKIMNSKTGLNGLSTIDQSVYYYNTGMAKFMIAGLNNKELIKEAISDFTNSYNIKPNNSYYFIGNGYLLLGDYKNAFYSYKKELLRGYDETGKYDSDIASKIMLVTELASYANYNPKTQHWAVPDWKINDKDLSDLYWNDLENELRITLAGRINYSNGVSGIDDKDYILSTINTLKGYPTTGIGKVYNLHINNDNYGNTSRMFVYPYSDGADTKATYVNSDDINLLIANQYFLLLRNSIGRIPHPYQINQSNVDDFFKALDEIPSNTALHLMNDIATYSLGGWDIFDDEDVSISFYRQMTAYININSITNLSKKTKENMKNAYIAMGDYYLSEEGINLASYYYNEATIYGASKFEVNEFIGDYYYNQNDYFKANEYYSKALAIKANAVVYLSRGQARAKLKDYDGAISDYNKAIGYNKNLAEAYWERAQMLFDQKKYSIAINDYIKYSSLNKNSAAAQYNAGICLYNTGKKQQAIPYLERAKNIAQRTGDQELYNASVKLINNIKGYNRGWY